MTHKNMLGLFSALGTLLLFSTAAIAKSGTLDAGKESSVFTGSAFVDVPSAPCNPSQT